MHTLMAHVYSITLLPEGRGRVFAACGVEGCMSFFAARCADVCEGASMAVLYFAALIEFTVIRGGWTGASVFAPFGTGPLTPLKTMRAQLRDSVCAVPLSYRRKPFVFFSARGFFCAADPPRFALLAGAALSAGIEFMQYLLMTGMHDIDDDYFERCAR
jgi:hypothetical protein